MRLTMILTTVGLILVGCSKDDGAGSSSASASAPPVLPPASSGNTSSLPPDYSKTLCGSVYECARACDLTHPYVDEASIRQTICITVGGSSGSTSNTCDSLVQFDHDNYIASNLWCKSLKVTEVIDPKIIGTQNCGDDSNCKQYCPIQYGPKSALAIEQIAAAQGTSGGETLKELVVYDVINAQLAACLGAPISFVMPSAN